MAVTAVATLHPVWDCKWSRPGYRLSRVAEPRAAGARVGLREKRHPLEHHGNRL